MVLEELIAVLGWDIQGEEKLRRFNAGLEQAAKRIATFATAAAVAGAGALAALGKSVIDVSAQFESLEASLTTVTGSSTQAKSAMDWISRFAAETPYEINGITEAFIRLKSYGIDPLADDALRTLGDTSSAMGKPLMQAVEAFADATTFEFERLKEFGLRAQQKGDEVTFSWTENGKQLSKTVRKNGEDVRRFVLDQLGDRFNGAMLRQSKTWNGMLSNLGDSWTAFLLKIGRGGFFDAVKNRLSRLLDYLGKLSEDGTLDKWAKNISSAFEGAADGAVQVVSRLVRHFEAFSKWVKVNPDLWDKIKLGLMALAAITFPKTAAIMVLEDLFTFMEGGDSVIGKFAKSLSELTGVDADALGKVLGTIAGSAAGLTLVSGPMKSVAGAIRALSSALGLIGSAASASGLGVLARLGLIGGAAAVLTGASYKAIKDTTADVAMVNKQGPAKDYSEQYSREENAARWWKQFGDTHFEGGWHRVGVGAGPAPGKGFASSSMLDNAAKNFGRMASGSAAAISSTVNDNSNRSVSVNITQNIQQASQAPGAAAQATGNAVAGAAAASGARRATWHELGEKF